MRKQVGLAWIDPSQQAQYFEERKLEGTVTQDSGATLEDALLVLEKYGVMPSKDDPYNDQDFAVNPPIKDFDKSLRLDHNYPCRGRDLSTWVVMLLTPSASTRSIRTFLS